MNKIKEWIFVFGAIFLVFLLMVLLFHEQNLTIKNLDDKSWGKKFQCIEYNALFGFDEDTYECPLSCQRIPTNLDTEVEECLCGWNNKTVYRYCRSKMELYEFTGNISKVEILT